MGRWKERRTQPLFILTCMRSYSSLVCAMLGQHPQMYSLPEQNLFVADTVNKLMKASLLLRPASLNGLARAVAEIEFGAQTEEAVELAFQWLKKRSHWSTQKVFFHFMDAVTPRICIDKSPSTGLTKAFLNRLRRMFPRANFLHLTRHPRPTCRSMYQLSVETNQRHGGKQTVKKDQAGLWHRINRNIMDFSRDIPVGQFMHIQGEKLLGEPDVYFPQIVEWLGLDAGEENLALMFHPENSPFAFIGPKNAPFGNDVNFLENPKFQHREIPTASLEGPLEWLPGKKTFNRETLELARELGYQ